MPKTRRPSTPGRLITTGHFGVPGLPHHHALTIYLPPHYETRMERHPVAYMFDGQNLFGDAGSFAGGWHMHAALDALAARKRRVPIVVGIHHGGASRLEELSPWAMGRGHRGRGDALLDWIVGWLHPRIMQELRVLPGPEHTMIGGASLGGLLALYALCRHPGVFGSALAMSPSLWVAGGAIGDAVRHAPLPAYARVYLDSGGREARGTAMRQARAMAGLLAAKGLAPGDRLMWRPDMRGSHNERNWRRRLPKALRFLYPA